MVAINSKSPVAWIVDHNPFYLLSALCMLFGCYTLQHAMNLQAGELWKLVSLLATINAYELLLVALGYLLYVRRGLVRDAGYVLMIELLFLVDAAFLNGETVTANLWVGGLINVILLFLGVFKVWVLLRALRVSDAGRILAFVTLELAVLYIMPGFFRRIGPAGTISATALYGVWWVVGALPFVRDVIFSLPRRNIKPHVEETRFAAVYAGLYTVVPYLSLLTHLWIMHWLYEVPFYWASLTPILLGLTMAARHLRSSPFMGARDLAIVRGLLPIIAVLFSMDNPEQLWLYAGTHAFSPLGLAFAGAFLTTIYCFLPQYRLPAIAAGVMMGLTYMYRNVILRLWQAAADIASNTGEWLAKFVPHTVEAWGLIAVIAAFVLLALGAWISMKRKTATEGGITEAPLHDPL